jgi:hypothetical protein
MLTAHVGTPVEVSADVEFTGRVESARLTLILGQDNRTITFSAMADQVPPPLGLGIFNGSQGQSNVVQVKTSFQVKDAGTYKIVGDNSESSSENFAINLDLN